jgi:predicted nucleic acid-binding protein
MSQLVVVDTCIFVDFFREKGSGNSALKSLINEERVVLSPFVKLELLAGAKKREQKVLSEVLSAFMTIFVAPNILSSAEELLPMVRNKGLNIGVVDYLVCMQALSAGCTVYTKDNEFKRLCHSLGVETY